MGARVGDLAGSGAVIRLDLGQAHGDGLAVDDGGQHSAEQARSDLHGQPEEVRTGRGSQAAGARLSGHFGGTWHHETSKPERSTTSVPVDISTMRDSRRPGIGSW